jgi:pimeloyl-ACP methyl ester carboxylesterase
MAPPDALELHRRTGCGEAWVETALELSDRNRERALRALVQGDRTLARRRFMEASAALRAAQTPLRDADPRKGRIYGRMVGDFAKAGHLGLPPVERVELPWKDSRLSGWLHRPRDVIRPPVVLVLGGIDAWREEFAHGANELLERGLAVLLFDAPGQGESRVLDNVHMDGDIAAALNLAVDHLLAAADLAPACGVWGNSMGGYLAALLASSDERIAACCVTGGSVFPAETHIRFPRFLPKVQDLLGIQVAERADVVMRGFSLDEQTLRQLTCPLLVQHGAKDPVFRITNARLIHDLAGSIDRTWQEWEDGDHCLDNHAKEKFRRVGEWFASRLV